MDTGGTKDRIGLCEFCGKKYFKRYNAQKYCCKSCADVAQAKRKREMDAICLPAAGLRKKCRYCGELFTPSDVRQQLCSDECRKASTKQNKLNGKKVLHGRPKTVERKRIQFGYSMADILEYMQKYDCQYGEAVRRMEGRG